VATTVLLPGHHGAPSGPDDELKELADTVDQLLDRLERSFAPFQHCAWR
jgi:hypothetical protein